MDSNSGDENSDDGLQIVLESPRPKKRNKKVLDETDRKIIECVEKDIEDNLEEKAAKANLTTKNVKNIIKEVVTNEHVLALVRHAENPEDGEPTLYEPKYTRAKTKQLLSTNSQPKILPWASPAKSVSEVQMLFTEELQEDSSGDEYIPDTPGKNTSCESQLDISQSTVKDDEEEVANIALRTRSKLSLSHTPLEVIEEAFMPPDITTDMYDMDCDDDVWKEFLKTFTRPLDEVTKAAEDEDHDPEYNILADEEIDEVDKEELRADRAVTVSRKEFNCLMAELFEFADIYESNKLNEKKSTDDNNSSKKNEVVNQEDAPESDSENDPSITIKKCQIPILAQQMRQHVQMLTQNFLLSYEHPEFSDMANKFREMLNDINEGSSSREAPSVYHAVNLEPAIKLTEYWENLFINNDKDALECKQYVEKVLYESVEAKKAGTQYIVTFPPFLMKTVSNSEVFIYPNLLPRIPFKSLNVTRSPYYFFTNGEEGLIALFLEQAIPQMKQDPFHLTKCKALNMGHVCHLINRFLMPHVSIDKIVRFIRNKRYPASEENPIKFFYRNKKAPPTVHYVVPMEPINILPPCKRSPDSLPLLWREYVYPSYRPYKNDILVQANNNNNQIIFISSPLQLRPVSDVKPVHQHRTSFPKKKVIKNNQPKGIIIEPINNYCRRKNRNRVKLPVETTRDRTSKEGRIIVTVLGEVEQNKMLPDMPSLGGTPSKNSELESGTTAAKDNDQSISENQNQDLSFKNIKQFTINFSKPEVVNQARRNFESISEFSSSRKESTSGGSTEKDNPDDINELMIASSTVKSVTKKEPSGAEKKRAKMRREFVSNLIMATPDDPEAENQKDENFADAFFDKLRHTLTVEDYDKLIDVLGHYDETNGEFLDLYKNVQAILSPSYKELSEEFLLFLTDVQAHKVGKLMPYFLMKDMDRFMRKLRKYFRDQPSQMKKIIKCLTDLSQVPDVSIETIKSAILPLLKGNVALTDWFLQLFPCERPPKILSNGPHEIIDMSKELARPSDENIYETVILPDTEDPYGGPTCVCHCHNDENPQFQSRSQHCIKCGLKFIQGKIFVPTGKALRPGVVSFLTNPEKDHLKRLTATQRKRSEVSPSKQVISPSKETTQTNEEFRHSNESDDEVEGKKKNQRQTKTQRKRKIKVRSKLNSTKDNPKSNNKEVSLKTCNSVKGDVKPTKCLPKKQNNKRNAITKKTTEHKPGSSAGQQKRPAEEQEIEYSESAEFVDLKVSSDHSGESESEFFESSQDVTNTDSEDSSYSPNSSPLHQHESVKHVSWTRDEDKIILQSFQQSSDNEETFKQISEVLQNRSVVEIKSRFHKLMSLLQQMSSSNK